MLGFLVLAACVAIYFWPTYLALKRKKNNVTAIAALNLFTGWTVIGWIIALVWALTVDVQKVSI